MKPLAKFAEDDALFDFDCTNLLAAGETIDSNIAVTMSSLPTFEPPESLSNLVIGVPVVNAMAVTYPDDTVMAIGKGFQVRISAGTSSDTVQQRTYAVLGVFTTSLGNVLTTKARLLLLPPGYPPP